MDYWENSLIMYNNENCVSLYMPEKRTSLKSTPLGYLPISMKLDSNPHELVLIKKKITAH